MRMEWASGHYYWREKCFRLMGDELAARPSDNPLFAGLGEGIALILADRISEGLAKLGAVSKQCPLATHVAMLYAHKQCQVVDRASVTKLEDCIRDEKKNAEIMELYYTAVVYYLLGHSEKALDFCEKHIKAMPSSSVGLALLGWIKSTLDKKIAALHFTSAIKLDKENVDALFGEVNLLGATEGIFKLNQAVVRYPKSITPLLIKMRLQLANREWEQCEESATRILVINPNNIYALHLKALRRIVEGRCEESLDLLDRLKEEIDRQENKAWWLYTVLGGVCARCCGGDPGVLKCCIAMAEAAVTSAQSTSVEPLLELAYQAYLASDYHLASKTYRAATKVDESSIDALTGLTLVQFASSGNSPQVQQQVEFLSEVRSSGGSFGGGEQLLMEAHFCKKSDTTGKINTLDKAVTALQTSASLHPFGTRYLIAINTNLLLRIAKAYPNTTEGDKRRMAVLRLIVETTPGLVEASVLLARVQLALNLHAQSMATVENIINNLDKGNPQAHLIMAQIHIEQADYVGAKSSLELGLSFNLRVRELPEYQLLTGLVELKTGNDDLAITNMQRALALNKNSSEKLGDKEIGKVYKELSGCLMRKGRLDEAKNLLEEAGKVVEGTGEEGYTVLASADLALLQSDVRLALNLLSTINRSQPHYVQAQMKKADIYLNHLKDGQAYSECFRKLAETDPTTENFLMVGDAYLAIQEPELAVQSYERAMVSSSGNAKLSCRLARVLVRCHQYAKAIKCYRDSGDEGSLELAELLLKLGQIDKAESALNNVPLAQKAFILAKVYEKGGDLERALRTLEAAVDEQSEPGNKQHNSSETMAKMHHQMAEYATMMRDFDSAIEYYKKSLSLKPDNPNAQISLAKLYMQVNDWSSCEAVCSELLTNDSNNEPALLMLADLAFRRVDFATAEIHFCTLLDRRPTYWVALARLIEVLRRSARLHLAKPYLEAATASASSPSDKPPLAYCMGLYHWYSGNTSLAIQKFNLARGDPEWGQQAVHNMVEACIGEPGAQALLSEMKPSNRDEEAGLQLITAFVRMATEEKQEIERAMIDFTYLANNDAHKVGATLGLAMGYVLQKQSTRARNMLKRVAKSVWQFEQAEHLEKSWLLLADLYIQAGGGKHEPAVDLLRRVITHNRTSPRAHELLGLIAEKEQKYIEASDHYMEAWKLSGECEPSLGYRLAYNLVKGKRHAEAISICHAVLKISPDYPRIRKDVLDKALAHLRT